MNGSKDTKIPCNGCILLPICRNRTFSENWMKCKTLNDYVLTGFDENSAERHWQKRNSLRPFLKHIT